MLSQHRSSFTTNFALPQPLLGRFMGSLSNLNQKIHRIQYLHSINTACYTGMKRSYNQFELPETDGGASCGKSE